MFVLLSFQDFLIKLIYFTGTAVCHQIPEKSFFAGSRQICLCARCEGIYLGFLFGAAFLFLMFRKKQSDIAPVYVIVIAILFIASTAVDGILSYLSVLDTNNYSRFITGCLAGSGAALIIYPVFNFQYYEVSLPDKIFSKPWQFITYIGLNAAITALAVINFKPANLVFFYLSPVAVIFTFFSANFLLIIFIPAFSKKAAGFFSKYLVLPSLMALVLTAGELFLFYRLHLLLKN
jgi:uncharacterized membrane protein